MENEINQNSNYRVRDRFRAFFSWIIPFICDGQKGVAFESCTSLVAISFVCLSFQEINVETSFSSADRKSVV